MNYIAQCLEKFRNLPESIKKILGGYEVLEIIEKLEEKYQIQLGLLVILIAIGEIGLNNVSEYVEKKYGFNEEDAFELQSDISREIFSLLLISNNEQAISITEAKDRVSKGVVELLNDKAMAEKINHGIFALLAENGSLQDDLSKDFLANQERLTNGHLELEGREVAPTIANWIKDFIKLNGSEMFDDLVLAQYLSTSPNAKKLNLEEKNLVRRVLKLYKNLNFFPESMENKAVDDWQLIPYEASVGAGEIRDVLSDEAPAKKSPAQKTAAPKVPAFKPKTTTPTDKSIEKNKTEKIMSPIEELQEALTEYTPGSLGYKAVVQEIERLKKKK